MQYYFYTVSHKIGNESIIDLNKSPGTSHRRCDSLLIDKNYVMYVQEFISYKIVIVESEN